MRMGRRRREGRISHWGSEAKGVEEEGKLAQASVRRKKRVPTRGPGGKKPWGLGWRGVRLLGGARVRLTGTGRRVGRERLACGHCQLWHASTAGGSQTRRIGLGVSPRTCGQVHLARVKRSALP
eukprot:3643767-Rhodomonas_salina.4